MCFRRFNLTTSYEYPSVIFSADLDGLPFFLNFQRRLFEALNDLDI